MKQDKGSRSLLTPESAVIRMLALMEGSNIRPSTTSTEYVSGFTTGMDCSLASATDNTEFCCLFLTLYLHGQSIIDILFYFTQDFDSD